MHKVCFKKSTKLHFDLKHGSLGKIIMSIAVTCKNNDMLCSLFFISAEEDAFIS